MGLIPCPRGHVVSQIPTKASGISRCSPELPSGHGGLDACHQSVKKGHLDERIREVDLLLTIAAGHYLTVRAHDSATLGHAAARCDLFSCYVTPFGPLAEVITLESKCSEKDRCCSLPARPGLSRDAATRMAEDQRIADERRRRLQRHSSGGQCGVRARLAKASRLLAPCSSSFRASRGWR